MKQAELSKYNEVVNNARDMWMVSAEEHFNEHGDVGSCVLGAGIKVEVVPPRCRKPRSLMLISANEVAKCQGSLHWEHNVQEIVNYLRGQGLDVYFDYGRMD